LSNSMHSYERTDRKAAGLSNKEVIDKLYPTENYSDSRIGYMQNIYYNTLLRLFHLDDIYRIPTREELKLMGKENEEISVDSDHITRQDINELRTDLRMLTKSIMLLSETLSVNIKQKPQATIIKDLSKK